MLNIFFSDDKKTLNGRYEPNIHLNSFIFLLGLFALKNIDYK